MNRKSKWLSVFLQTLSYVLVAAAAAATALYLYTPGQSKLDQLESIIGEKFIGETDTTKLQDAAAHAMVEAIGDPWSYYVPAAEYKAFQQQHTNTYVGIGVTIQQSEDGSGCEIVKVSPEGSAMRAGVEVGDILIEVDGTSLEGVGLQEVVSRVQGEEGTEVSLVFLRAQKRVPVTLKREAVQEVVAFGKMLPDQIGYVRIYNFNSRCADQTLDAVKSLEKQGAKALVFDVRNNGGGYVEEMVKILDYLLPEGELFRSVDYNGTEKVRTSDASCLKLPMAVLVNGRSYSAAEFFAAALSEYHWGTLVGEHTTGKNHFQYALTLNDGSVVNLSVGKYLTPNGVDLRETGGLTPDITVKTDEETDAKIFAEALEPEQDPQIQAAVENLLKSLK